MNVRKPILENPVYSELLIELNKEKLTATELYKKYYEETELTKNWGLRRKDKKKTRVVIRKQLLILKEKGYVGMNTQREENKKYAKNKKYFYVKYEKIVEEFIKYVLKNTKPKERNLFRLRGYEEGLKELKENVEKYKKNFFIKNFFSELFFYLRRVTEHNEIIINDVFDNILSHNIIDKARKNLMKEFNYEESYYRDPEIWHSRLKYENIPEDIEKEFDTKDFTQEFDTFWEFSYNIPEMTNELKYNTEAIIYSIRKSVLGEEEADRRRRKREDIEADRRKIEEIDHRIAIPIYEIDESISIEEAKKDLKKIEEIKKSDDLKSVKKLAEDLTEKYHFLPYARGRWYKLHEITDASNNYDNAIPYLIETLLYIEYAIMFYYDLASDARINKWYKDIKKAIKGQRG